MIRSRGPARPIVLPAVVLAVVLAAAGCTGGGGTGQKAGTGFVSGDNTIAVVPPAKRKEPIVLSGKTLDGKTLDLTTYRGKPVVINVWGSWCSPCRKEAPALQAASVSLQRKGIPLIGINVFDSPSPARAFERKFKITYPSVADDGTKLLALRGAVSAKGIPTTLVLDAQGRIAARSLAPMTETGVIDLVQDATGS